MNHPSDLRCSAGESAGKPLLALLLCAIALPVAAQSAPDARLRDQLRQTTTQLRTLEDENASLKASNQALTQQLAQRPEAPAAAVARPVDDAELRGLRTKLQQEKDRSAELEQKLTTVEPILGRWKQSYEQVATMAKTRDADARRFEADYQQSHAAQQACVADNISLVQIGNELIGQYRDKGVWSTMRDKEPLLGISRIKFEKLAQDYHARINDASVPAAATEESKP
jgi:DNA repair exonuclease SbcCD ATPase subunit